MESQFALNIKALRLDLNDSQEAMSAKLGVKRSTYGGWESGRSEPSLTDLMMIQEVHQVGLDVLVRASLHRYTKDQLGAARTAFAPRPRMNKAA